MYKTVQSRYIKQQIFVIIICVLLPTSAYSATQQGFTRHKIHDMSVMLANSLENSDKYLKLVQKINLEFGYIQIYAPRLYKVSSSTTLWIADSTEGSRVAFYNNQHGVEVTNIDTYLRKRASNTPIILLHELAHAYHNEVLGFGNKEIIKTYKSALAKGKYRGSEYKALDRKGQDAYASTSVHEYFAEISVSYFGKNWRYPFTRKDLSKYDPLGYDLMIKTWEY